MSAARVKCPSCGRAVEWTQASPHRPFCSERCRLLDLGAWLSEQHAIPGETVADEQDADGDPQFARRTPPVNREPG